MAAEEHQQQIRAVTLESLRPPHVSLGLPQWDHARSMEFPIIRRSRRAGRLLSTDDQSKLIQDERDFHDNGICQFFRVGSLIGLIWAWAQEEKEEKEGSDVCPSCFWRFSVGEVASRFWR